MAENHIKLFKKLLAIFVVFVLVFLGWLQIRNAQALNKVNNPFFATDASGWTVTNGSGTNVCGSTTSTTGTSFEIFAFDGTVGNPSGSFKAELNTTSNNVSRYGKITQTVVAPGSGTVKAKGRFDFSANAAGTQWSGTADTSWIRLDLYNSTDSTFVANLTCTSFNSNQAWTTASFGSDASLTGGTTYTIRLTFKAQNSSTNGAIDLWADNIIVDFAPTGLSASLPADTTTNTSLSWTASTAGTGAAGLHGTTPYKVYRNTASPVSTFLANATTNSYSDTSTVGNTTYYYAVSDVDTNSIESPLSAEASVLTRPGTPGTPTFSSVGETSLRVNWTAPTGGATSYKVERCQGSGCTGFSQIASGVTTAYYDDSSLSANTTYRYQVRATNASGDGAYSGIGTTLTLPAAPGTPTFSSVGETSLRVNWTAPTGGATSYKVERCQGSGCTGFSQIASGVTTAYYDDSSLSANTTYRYQVRATNASGDGAYSGIGDVTTAAAPQITVSSTGTQASSLTIPSSDQYVGGALTFARNTSSATVTQIIISETGSVNAQTNLSNLKLYYETAGSCSFGGTETLFGTASSFNSSQKATVTGSMSVGTSQICVYATIDVGSGASNSQTLEIEISNPSTEVTASAGSVTPATAVAISGTTTLSVPLPGTPGTPTFSNISETSLRVNWTAATGATSYKVERCQGSGCTGFSQIASGVTTAYYDDSSLSANTTYRYQVRATNAGGDGDYSGIGTTLTLPAAPGTPTFSSVDETTLTVNWTAPTGGATSYKVERCQGSGCTGFSQIASGVTNTFYNDSSLSANTTYRYQVRATNASGDGAYSEIGNVTTSATPVITVSATDTQTSSMIIPSTDQYVGGAFTFSRSAGSADITQITLTEQGTVNANADLSNVRIYYETVGTCSYDGGETLFGSGSFNVSAKAAISGTMSVGTSQVCAYLVLDVGSGASDGQTLEIEISNPSTEVVVSAGTVAPSTAVAISGTTTLSVIPSITVSTTGTQTGSMIVSSANNNVGGAFTFSRSAGSTTVTQIIVSETGTVNANTNLSNLKLYYETAGSCSFEGTETAFNSTGVSFNSSAKATATGSMTVGTSQICVYATLNVGSGASDGQTLEIEISNPSTEVTASAGTVAPSSAVAISGTTTLLVRPSITSISPNNGKLAGGTNVTITGTGFLSGATVTFGGTSATNISVVSGTSITATTPAHSAGAVDVVVTNTNGQSGTSTGGYTYNQFPTVSNIDPSAGPTGGNTSVTITGTGFLSGATVTFGGTSATNISVVSGTSITATTPAHTAGAVDVVVTNADTQSGTLSSGFSYTSGPVITSISPDNGKLAGGTNVTITGGNFQSGVTITFDSTPATNVVFVSGTSITATTPTHSSGAVNVTVTNPDSQSHTLTGGYTYNPFPTVSSVSPSSGSTSGTNVTITGTGFLSGATVTFGGTSATNISVVSGTSITATTPAHTVGTVDVVVTNTDTQSGTSLNGFEYVGPPTINLTASPTTIFSGELSVLNWTSTNADTCTASGSWSGGKSTTGNEIVSPTTTSTYALTCDGPGGSAQDSVTVTVSAQAPTVEAGGPSGTQFRFGGFAYAGGTVIIYDSGAPIARLITGDDGSFSTIFRVDLTAKHLYSVIAYDKDRQSSPVKTFPSDIYSSRSVADILIAPTINLSKRTISKTGEINIYGYATPKRKVKIEIDGQTEKEVTSNDATGYYSVTISAAKFSEGSHKIRTKQINSAGKESDYSILKLFSISEPFVANTDLNGDNILNITDWSIFLGSWASKDEKIRSKADLNSDGKINISDLSIFLNAFSKKKK